MKAVTLFLIGLSTVLSGALEADLDRAARSYDLSAARETAQRLAADPGPEAIALRPRAYLLVAELLRIEFEALEESAAKARRTLGSEIDAAAEAGLAALAALPEDSEHYRIKADLLGTKIRSNYRAGKYKDEMNRAIEQALALDPGNARALVSSAKTLIFRPDPEPAALHDARALLDRALALDITLEQARLLQAHVCALLGDRDGAVALWEQCLRENPSCVPAARALEAP